MSRNRKSICIALWTLLLLLAQPASVLACAACYGDTNSTMSVGLTWAISIMVGVVACVLAGIVAFFIRTARHTVDLSPHNDLESKAT